MEYEQMVSYPYGWGMIRWDKLGQWHNWLNELERSQLWHEPGPGDGEQEEEEEEIPGSVYRREFNLDELLKPLAWYLDEENDTQRIMDKLTLGDFSIPVRVTDWGGNDIGGNIDLTIVDIMQPLKKGWNLVSTPVTLEDGYATLETIFNLGGGPIIDVLEDVMWYDPDLGWGSQPTDEFKPLKALYIYVTGNTQIGFIFNRGVTLPPSLYFEDGWNLVSLAIPPTEWDSMPVNEAMVTVEDVAGYRGYSIVISMDRRVEYGVEYRYQDAEGGKYHFGGYDWHFHQSPWIYTIIGSYNIPEMSIGGGYWVFMEDADTLAGFSTTPVTIIGGEIPIPGPGEPQYGGTITVSTGYGEAATADMAQSYWPTVYYTNPVIDYLIIGDFEKYDAKGTNEFVFRVLYTVPEEFTRGNLVESWEVTADKIVYHIRPGVYWAAIGKEHVMESREYTAYDTEFSLNRYTESPAGQAMLAPGDWIKSIYAEDKWTVIVETNFFNARWKWLISTGWGNAQYAAEVVAAGVDDWDNLVGTGPWMLKEYIVGSAFIYERNSIFWDTTVINGKEYEIPFADELIFPIVVDESTRMAALRTGKIDLMPWVSYVYEETLDRTSPEMIKMTMSGYHMVYLALRMNDMVLVDDEAVFTPTEILGNKEVRRALMIGLDRQTIMRATAMEGDIYGWPMSLDFTSIATPIDELPAKTQELFEYDPVKAKQMLADEGHPDGFKLTMVLKPASGDLASLITDMWAEWR